MRPWLPLLLLLAPDVAQAATFTLSSSAFAEGGTLAKAQLNGTERCGGGGGDRSPPLAWKAPPAGTKAFAVTMFDPDARGGRGWWHWTLFDLPPDTRALEEDSGKPGNPPEGAQSAMNSFGTAGYGGACPPPGDPPHHYVFTVWAVGDDKLPFDAGSSDEEVGAWLAGHALGKATLTARYGR